MENGLLKKRLAEHIAVANAALSDAALLSGAEKLAQRIVRCYEKGGKVIVMGNGGSAADAQHMAAELLGKYLKERRSLPAVALTANSSAVTAIGNDYGYERVFARQLEGWLAENDVVIGISTSGNSKNVVAALKYAKGRGAFCAALVGAKACELDSIADLSLKVQSDSTPRIQEMHILIIHSVCEIIEETLFGQAGRCP